MATIPRWSRLVNRHLLDHPEVQNVLSPAVVEAQCRRAGHQWRDSFWSPTPTLIAFLIQVLSGAKTLRAGVAQFLTHLAAHGHTCLPSADPTAYCQARKRLPAEVINELLSDLCDRMVSLIKETTTWLGHRVWVVDGSSASMPDTPELQQAFPQPESQKPGCGFPVAQIVAVFCWATGALVDLVIDTITPHELTLVRRLYGYFNPGDVVLADRAYGAYVDIARLRERGVFCVFRLHQRRKADFRRGKRLGPNDRLVTWHRPAQWIDSFGVSREAFEKLPETLTVRLVRITHVPRGFRSRTVTVVTTLLDPIETPADEIRALYRDRWTVELNLRSLKIALGMDVLRGQSVDVVCKEIAMHLLAYNLIRMVMWYAAREHGRDLHRLSFTGTLHRLRSALFWMMYRMPRKSRQAVGTQLLRSVAQDILPDRPDRLEPRRVKRRPKQYGLLVKPRSWYHLQGGQACR